MPLSRRSHLRTCNNRDHNICQNRISLEEDSVQLTSSAFKGLVSAFQVPENNHHRCRSRGYSRGHGENYQQCSPRLEAVHHARHKEINQQIRSLKIHVAHMTEEISSPSLYIAEIGNLLKLSHIQRNDTQEVNLTPAEGDSQTLADVAPVA